MPDAGIIGRKGGIAFDESRRMLTAVTRQERSCQSEVKQVTMIWGLKNSADGGRHSLYREYNELGAERGGPGIT